MYKKIFEENLWKMDGSTIRENLNQFKKNVTEMDFLFKVPAEMFSNLISVQSAYYRHVYDEFMQAVREQKHQNRPYVVAEAASSAMAETYRTACKVNDIMQAASNEIQRHTLEKTRAAMSQMCAVWSNLPSFVSRRHSSDTRTSTAS